jgi:hypothetical protein
MVIDVLLGIQLSHPVLFDVATGADYLYGNLRSAKYAPVPVVTSIEFLEGDASSYCPPARK